MVGQRTKRNKTLYPVLCCLVLYLALGGCSQKPEPPLPLEKLPPEEVPPGMIAFISDSGKRLYVMGTDGSNQTHIVGNGDHVLSGPRWSPDGQYIAFRSEDDIWVVEADGTGQVNVSNHTASDYEYRWSPDSRRIVFTSNRDGNREVYVVHRDGSGLKNLTNHALADDAPTWSPDGSRIAFYSERDGGGIYIMDADGTNPERLVEETGVAPVWSPDGRQLACFSDGSIYVIDLDDPAQIRLVTTIEPGNLPASYVELSWSPDGRYLALVDYKAIPLGIKPEVLMVVDTEGSILLRIPGLITGYDWSPDGQYIVLSSCQDCTPTELGISIVHIASRRQFQLTDNAARDEYPAWRPQVAETDE